MNIDRNEILAVYRKTHEEMTYQTVCMRLAIEQLEKRNQELESRIRELEAPTPQDEQ